MLMLIVQIEMTPFDQCRKGGLGAVTKLSATSALIKGTPSADSYKNVSNLEIRGVWFSNGILKDKNEEKKKKQNESHWLKFAVSSKL